MFPPRRYETAAVSREIPLAVQLFLWQCIDALPFSPDYLQVFEFSTDSGRLKIAHTQECPYYCKEYLLLSDVPITAKIYVINDKTHATIPLFREMLNRRGGTAQLTRSRCTIRAVEVHGLGRDIQI